MLHETALIEAFNLKAAIEYQLKNGTIPSTPISPAAIHLNILYAIIPLSEDEAIDALTDMPPRDESELDPVTLHNQVSSHQGIHKQTGNGLSHTTLFVKALMNMEEDPTAGFEKFQFLLQQNPCPPGRPLLREPSRVPVAARTDYLCGVVGIP